ncbi:hypothetical protein P8452_67337 [Trifolium repens]|jgi:hypothetical protein|nr:hypothetical protein QL285_089241 [Trifolium repens]WJX84806.1 hypothetical protein P8452_67337 [Trifolium repens]
MEKANHELHLKNLLLVEENERLRNNVVLLKEEHQQLFSELMNKLSNDGANNPQTNAPNNMLDLTLRLGPCPNASNAPNNMLDLNLRLGPSSNASNSNN